MSCNDVTNWTPSIGSRRSASAVIRKQAIPAAVYERASETVLNGKYRADRSGGKRFFIGEDHLALGKSVGAKPAERHVGGALRSGRDDPDILSAAEIEHLLKKRRAPFGCPQLRRGTIWRIDPLTRFFRHINPAESMNALSG